MYGDHDFDVDRTARVALAGMQLAAVVGRDYYPRLVRHYEAAGLKPPSLAEFVLHLLARQLDPDRVRDDELPPWPGNDPH